MARHAQTQRVRDKQTDTARQLDRYRQTAKQRDGQGHLTSRQRPRGCVFLYNVSITNKQQYISDDSTKTKLDRWTDGQKAKQKDGQEHLTT